MGKDFKAFCEELEKIRIPSHRVDIYALPDNVLLEVFDFYRMYGESLFPPHIKTTWKWHELVHVCRRWRCIIFKSPRRLNLELICTRGTPVRRNLGCWPAFPITIDFYSDISSGGTGTVDLLGPDEEDDVIVALEHPNRVHRIGLGLTHSQLLKVSTAMRVPFSALTRFWLVLMTLYGDVPVSPALPNTFLGGSAPRLQHIYIDGIPFPALPTLLSSAVDLVELQLAGIPNAGYISPEVMVASLAALTRLKTLCIAFQSPTSRPSPIRLPPLIRTDLPALTEFRFRGVSEYLEDFVAQINTPRLRDFKITYFNQLDFQVPQLSRFFRRQGILSSARLYNFHLEFSRCETRFKLTSSYQTPSRYLQGYFPPEGPGFSLEILSEGLDWQASHLTQVLTQCIAVLSDVDHLFIGNGFSRPDQHDGMDDTEWLGLIGLFTTVKSLIVSEEMAGYITHALDTTASEMVVEAMPALRLLYIRPENQSAASVEQAVSLRRLSSQTITIVGTQREFDRHRSLLTKEKVPDTLLSLYL